MPHVPALVCVPPRLDIEAPGAHAQHPFGVVTQRWRDHDGRLIATGGHAGESWWMHWPGLATFWFDEDGPVRAQPAHTGLDDTIRDIFTRGVTPVVLLARGYEGLHAGGIAHARGLVALMGTSGTGKSTTAFALARAGATHFADDTIIYTISDGSPLAVRLPFPVRVDVAVNEEPERRGQERAPADTPNSLPFHRIYHLLRDGSLDPARPEFAAVPAFRRFELLLAHAHPFEMGPSERRRALVEHLMTLAREVDTWECRFAPRLDALPAFTAALADHIDRV